MATGRNISYIVPDSAAYPDSGPVHRCTSAKDGLWQRPSDDVTTLWESFQVRRARAGGREVYVDVTSWCVRVRVAVAVVHHSPCQHSFFVFCCCVITPRAGQRQASAGQPTAGRANQAGRQQVVERVFVANVRRGNCSEFARGISSILWCC